MNLSNRSKTPTKVEHFLFCKYKQNQDINQRHQNNSLEHMRRLPLHNNIISNEYDMQAAKPMNVFPPKNKRYIVLDTETTGLDVNANHLVSINAVEVINCQLTGIQYHAYIQPRNKPNQASKYNLYLYYLEDYANERYDNAKASLKDFLRFVGNDTIITHNARFDIKFINKALKECDLPLIDLSKCVCSLQIARKRRQQGYFQECADLTVKSLCMLYNVQVKECDYHHGIVDAVALARIVCKMWEDTKQYNITNIKQSVKENKRSSKKKKKEQTGNQYVQEVENVNINKGRKVYENINYNKFDIVGDVKGVEENYDKKKEEFSLDIKELNKELEKLNIGDNNDSNYWKGNNVEGKQRGKYHLRDKGKKVNNEGNKHNKQNYENINSNDNNAKHNNININKNEDNNVNKQEMKANLKNLLMKANINK